MKSLKWAVAAIYPRYTFHILGILIIQEREIPTNQDSMEWQRDFEHCSNEVINDVSR